VLVFVRTTSVLLPVVLLPVGGRLNSQIGKIQSKQWKWESTMASARIVSFDLDGTLTDISFVDSVWLEGMPRRYALKNDVPFEVAKGRVMSEYGKVGREKLDWYDLGYWIRRFGLDVSPEEVLSSFQHRIMVYPEVHDVLEMLRDMGFRLIIVTNARREFADLELEKTKILPYFERVFSSTSDFGLIKNSVSVYRKVCSICDVLPSEVVHVGDDSCFDFDVPSKLGIISFYLDRTGKHSGEFVVSSLKELSQKLAGST
jgi:HAD superfamily hydrolase (TIGR01549 family)